VAEAEVDQTVEGEAVMVAEADQTVEEEAVGQKLW
jgi:hypothetical protein